MLSRVGQGRLLMRERIEQRGERGFFVRAASGIANELATVWRFLKQGVDFPLDGRHPLEGELRALAGPYMPVLVHKRVKLADESEFILGGRWLDELAEFAERVVCYLEAEWLDRRQIVGLLDDIIAEEQQKIADALRRESVPVTSRFDMSWAN
jgi:hypothetical protein